MFGMAIRLAVILSVLPCLSFAGQRYYPITQCILGPWYGSGCPTNGNCACGQARTAEEEFNCQLDNLLKYDIPISVYLFDGDAWSKTNSWANCECEGQDCCNWKLGQQVIERMRDNNIRALLHFWGGCHQPEQYMRAYEKLGDVLLGFYLDGGASDKEAKRAIDFMQSVMPRKSEVNMKAFDARVPSMTLEGIRKLGNTCYIGDLSYNFMGMREGIRRVFRIADLLPGPYNEFAGYAYKDNNTPDEETYIRRLHFGCFQVVMANTPYANSDPWLDKYSPKLIEAYRYYSWLHKELVPYLFSYSWNMHENPGEPVYRNCDPCNFTTKLGDEIFVAYVTDYMRTIDIKLPEGQWLNYWDEQQVVTGSAKDYPVPLGKEPIFIRNGAIIPMDVERDYTAHGTRESKGSITVLVYPHGKSEFRYRDEAADRWYVINSDRLDDTLKLDIRPAGISTPIIYRIARWNKQPKSVDVSRSTVMVNKGGALKNADSERQVNGAKTSAWYYDADTRRLIIKVVPQPCENTN